jgi:dihydroneopterin aldolase
MLFMDRILLNGLVFFGRHGCHAAEKELGQKFTVDVELECDLQRAGETDALEDTVDYVAIYNATKEIIEGQSVQLLEVLAQQIADFALNDPKVLSAWVRIRKPHVAMPGPLDYLGVEITRTRDDVDGGESDYEEEL